MDSVSAPGNPSTIPPNCPTFFRWLAGSGGNGCRPGGQRAAIRAPHAHILCAGQAFRNRRLAVARHDEQRAKADNSGYLADQKVGAGRGCGIVERRGGLSRVAPNRVERLHPEQPGVPRVIAQRPEEPVFVVPAQADDLRDLMTPAIALVPSGDKHGARRAGPPRSGDAAEAPPQMLKDPRGSWCGQVVDGVTSRPAGRRI
jgi:hypothetical protein